MQYEQLTAEYIADRIAENMYHREVEHLQYQLNIDTFQATVDTLEPGSKVRVELEQRIVAERTQQAVGERAYDALKTLIKDPTAHQEAITRVKAKREAEEATITTK